MKNFLPANVYRLSQNRFSAVPSRVWNYWLIERIRNIFFELKLLSDLDPAREGINTGDNTRFVRFWWEVKPLLGFTANSKFVPFIKGAPRKKFYDRIDESILNDITQLQLLPGSAMRNLQFSFMEAIAFLSNSSEGFRARYIGYGSRFCSTGGRAVFPSNLSLFALLALINSKLINYILHLLNPTMSITVGDIGSLPIPNGNLKHLELLGVESVRNQRSIVINEEESFEFLSPSISNDKWNTKNNDIENVLESQIDQEVYRLYDIFENDRFSIEGEMAGGILVENHDSEELPIENEDLNEVVTITTPKDLPIRWISYGIGIVLGRFRPGVPDELGSAIYYRSDFAIDSLPEPSQVEFDQLVGPSDYFAYIDRQGGRHVFSEKVEKDLQALALPDGIAILDEGHERDLTSRVSKALEWMLGEKDAREVIQEGAGGDLRSFLNKDYFTQYHLRWYRKCPVYWYIQSAKRSFGFVIFHEKIDKNTFYTLQHEVANKRKAIQFQLEDMQKALLKVQGSPRKQVEKNIFELHLLDEELSEFAQALEGITSGGYEPESNWIDDGVILRMAPLWNVIPLWKSEPKKYWERLEKGDFDWSRIAMKYWPERVRDKCRTNKSFAIAHGHEDWFEGD